MTSEKISDRSGEAHQGLQGAIKKIEGCGDVPELLAVLADVFDGHLGDDTEKTNE